MQNKNRLTNIILALVAVVLACLCVHSVTGPVVFEKKQQQREVRVKAGLIKIREAQSEYERQHGRYCPSLESLVAAGLLIPSDVYVPYSDGMSYELTVDSIRMRTGEYMPLMQCGARYDDYLFGLDESMIEQLTLKAVNAGRYPGLVIGSTETPNGNAGNWE